MSENTNVQREPMTADKFSEGVKSLLHGSMVRAVEAGSAFGLGKDLPRPVTADYYNFSAESTLKLALLTPRSARETGDGRFFTKNQLEANDLPVPDKGGILVDYPNRDGETRYGIVYHASKIDGLEPINTREVTGPLKVPALSMSPERVAAEVDQIGEKFNMYVGNLVNQNFRKEVEKEAPVAKIAEPAVEAPAKKTYKAKSKGMDR
jgi:hypothetical protein